MYTAQGPTPARQVRHSPTQHVEFNRARYRQRTDAPGDPAAELRTVTCAKSSVIVTVDGAGADPSAPSPLLTNSTRGVKSGTVTPAHGCPRRLCSTVADSHVLKVKYDCHTGPTQRTNTHQRNSGVKQSKVTPAHACRRRPCSRGTFCAGHHVRTDQIYQTYRYAQ